MKKLIVSGLMLGSMMFALPAAETVSAASVTASESPQIVYRQTRNRRGRWNRRARTVTTTRIRWVGPYRYRETIRTTYLPNGRTRTVVINRVRLGRRG